VLTGGSGFLADLRSWTGVSMRRLCLMLVAAVGLPALPAMGQEPTPQDPQKKVTIVHTHDGGVTEVLQSIVVPPKAGAPFTLTLAAR